MAELKRLGPSERGVAVSVLCDAFHDYPVMRFVIGPEGEQVDGRSTASERLAAYDRRLTALVDFFAHARTSRGDPVLAVMEGRAAVAVALVTPPGDGGQTPELVAHRERVWTELGSAARSRYEAFTAATRGFVVAGSHYHLNMLAVRRAHAGRGLARRLLDAVHGMSAQDPESCGVTLSTEDPSKVTLYEHFGYRRIGHVRVAAELETWGFFRADATPV